MEIKKDILWRVYLCFLGIVLLGVFVIGKVIYIQQAQGDYWRNMGDSLHLKFQPLTAERGSIYSDDDNMLSTSVPIFDVYVDFAAEGLRAKNGKRFKDNLDSLSLSLANLFNDQPAAAYKKNLQLAYANKERYYPLKKKISFDEFRAVRNFPLVRQGRNKSGFIIEPKDKRINPYVLLANRTIGLSRNDPKQNVGLELTYDSLLRGVSGKRLMRYAAGSYIPVEGAEVEPINGYDIVTTLDTYIQDVAQNALMNMLVENNSTHGCVVVMEVATGKIKAMANLGQQPDGSYIEDLNYAVGKATEPGSVFKLASLLSLLEDKYVNTNTIVDCGDGSMKFSGLTIRDSHRGTGKVTVKKAFYTSSNVAFAKLINDNYQAEPMKYINHLQKFHLDKMTGIEIVASSGKPTIKTTKNRSWSKTTLPYMAHGYEELVTPLHMLMLYNAVANNGRMMKPYLVSAFRNYGVDVQQFEPVVLEEKICSDETIAMAKECLKAVVDSVHGTAHRVVYDPLYSISGKTGTAVSALDNRGYNKGNKIYQASFIGFFPSEKPIYSMAVVIQNSNKSKKVYGADVSGTVFKEISDKIYGRYANSNTNIAGRVDSSYYFGAGYKNDFASIFNFLQIPYTDATPSGSWRNMAMQNARADVKPPADWQAQNNTMPNVLGMGLKDVVYLLENKGLKLNIAGRGRVISQSIPVGTVLQRNQKIEVTLN